MISFPQSIVTVLRAYAEFRGRASRAEFWWFALFAFLVSTALNSLNVVTPDGTVYLGASLSGFWSIGILLPSLAVAIRRLRDAGFAWGHIFWLLLPVAGLIVLIVLLAQPPRSAEPGAPATPPAPISA